MRERRSPPSPLVFAVLAAAAAALSWPAGGCGRREAEWPQFRGPAGLGVGDAGELPTTWSATSPNVRWRTRVPGRGNSSPVVAAGRVFLTTALEGGRGGPSERAVVALDLATGELLWRTAVHSGPWVRHHRFNSHAGPTPAADGDSVYAYFGSHLARLTHEGELVWRREIDPDYARYAVYGAASSPVLAGDAVVVVQDQETADTDDVGWMAAFDRETGERLWRHGYPMTQFVGGLVVEGDVVCALGGAHNHKGNLCARVTGPSRGARVEQLWYQTQRAPEVSSAVLYRGRLYALTQGGVLSCYDPATGKLHWAERLEGGRGYRASLVAGDGKLYALPTWGAAAVVDAAAPDFRALAYNSLGEGDNNATPAIAGGCLLVRTAERLFCIAKEGREAS